MITDIVTKQTLKASIEKGIGNYFAIEIIGNYFAMENSGN